MATRSLIVFSDGIVNEESQIILDFTSSDKEWYLEINANDYKWIEEWNHLLFCVFKILPQVRSCLVYFALFGLYTFVHKYSLKEIKSFQLLFFRWLKKTYGRFNELQFTLRRVLLCLGSDRYHPFPLFSIYDLQRRTLCALSYWTRSSIH